MDMKELSLALQTCMIEKRKTLALAESCTGGFLAHLITQNPNASKFFLGSFVVYSPVLKSSILGVRESTLRKYSSESEETALEMVEGLYEMTQADLALAITGLAGPTGATPDKPIGSLWMAISRRGQVKDMLHQVLPGNRLEIIQEGSRLALEKLYEYALTL